MSVHYIFKPHNDNGQPPETTGGILENVLAQRLRRASESNDFLIRESAKIVLEAEALLLEALEEMDRNPLKLED